MSATVRPKLVILHGASGTAATMQPLLETIGPDIETIALDLVGHGGRPVPEKLSIEALAADVISQLDSRALTRVFLFGYSAGGCLALYLASHFPERFVGISTLASKYVFDERTIAHWTHLTDPARISRPGSKRPEELTRDHYPQRWVDVVSSNRRMFEDWRRTPPLREDDLRTIAMPVLLFSSDSDQLVTIEETIALGNLLANSRVVVFRGQSHPLKIVPLTALGRALTTWIGEVQAGKFETTAGAP